MKRYGRKLWKRTFAWVLAFIMAIPAVDYGTFITAKAQGAVNVLECGGYEEGAYAEWSPVEGADGYLVYVSKDQNNWQQPIDDELIRSYGTYFRADALGLTAGTWHIRIEAASFNENKEKTATVAEKVETVTVTAHDRSGYAWEGNGTASGAYNEDGSLKSDANVIYVTNANKDKVELTVDGASKNPCVGLQAIMDGYKQGKATKPLNVRIIGNVEDFAVMSKGDIAVENGKNAKAGITIEGVGKDAVANGWGIRLDNSSNVEIRNMGFMNCDSSEGDNVSLQNNNEHIWVHNCDFFYGEAGSDGDQKKGDGMLDCKNSNWVTFSYNHFWDSGKSSLLGLIEGTGTKRYITYHHNWFDHSDSRHPRIRYYITHIYNNYYDGNAKYGIGAAEGGTSIFAESNYFRNCKFPMLISQQGSDLTESNGKFEKVDKTPTDMYENGSMIKAYGNHIEGAKSFIPYAAPASQADSVDSVESEEEGFIPYAKIDDNEGIGEKTDNNENAAAEIIEDGIDAAIADGIDAAADIMNDEVDADEAIADGIDADGDIVSEGGMEGADADSSQDTGMNQEDVGTADIDNAADTDGTADGSADMDNEEVPGENTQEESGLNAEVSYAQSSAFTNDTSVDFDAYVVENRNDKVPETVKTKKGGFTYNNFDTEEGFYTYKADNAEDVPAIVMAHAGRVNGGDFKFEFTAADDSSYELNQKLKDKCTGYTSTLVAVGGINSVSTTVYYTITFDPGNGDASYEVKVETGTPASEPAAPTNIPAGKVAFDGWYNGFRKWNFADAVTEDMTLTGRWLAEGEKPGEYGVQPIGTSTVIHDFNANGKDSPYFTITGDLNTKTGISGSYNGVRYSSGGGGLGRLDMANGSPTVTFTTTTTAGLVLFLRPDKTGKRTNVDGTARTQTNGIISVRLAAGEHTISNRDSDYLYAIMVVPLDASRQFKVTVDKADGSEVTELKVNEGDSVTTAQLAEPVRDNYAFAGWKNDSGEAITLPYMPLKDITLKASWTVTVTFDTRGGSSVAEQKIEEGAVCVKPAEPVKEGDAFVGWYTDTSFAAGAEYNFESPVTESITLYARWESDNVAPETVFEKEPELKSSGSLENPHPDDVLTLEYSLGEANDAVDASAIKWYRVPADGTAEEITAAANSKTYTISDDDIGCIIKAEVTPNITGGTAGASKEAVLPAVVASKNIPSEKGLKIDFVDGSEYTYTGSAIKPEIVVTNNGKCLIEGIDYSVKYSNNTNVSANAAVTVSGKGILAGKATKKFTIDKKDITTQAAADGALSEDDIKAGRMVVVKGSKIAAPVLYYGGIKLKAGKDFTYDANKTFSGENADETLTVTGTGNYKGTRDIAVKVVADSKALKNAINKFSVTVIKDKAASELIYTGGSLEEAIKGCITVADKTDKNKKLKSEDGKYVIAFPANVTDAGTVKFTVIGLDEYSGCNVTASCKILPRTLTGVKEITGEGTDVSASVNEAVVDYGADYDKHLDYSGTGAVFDSLSITWTNSEGNALTLTEGKDYKISYSGNKKAGTAAVAKCTITFKGNYKYKGKCVKNFTIDKAQLSADAIDEVNGIVIADKVCAGKNGVYQSAPYVNINGVQVKASEYDVKYYTDESMAPDTEMTKTHPLDVQNKAYATVYVKVSAKAGSKNYVTSPESQPVTGSYKVWVKNPNKLDLSTAKVLFYKNENDAKPVTKLDYTGEAVVPGKIAVTVGGKPVPESDYTYTVINNTNKGKATVLIYARDEQGAIGGKAATFSVGSYNLSGLK